MISARCLKCHDKKILSLASNNTKDRVRVINSLNGKNIIAGISTLPGNTPVKNVIGMVSKTYGLQPQPGYISHVFFPNLHEATDTIPEPADPLLPIGLHGGTVTALVGLTPTPALKNPSGSVHEYGPNIDLEDVPQPNTPLGFAVSDMESSDNESQSPV